MRIDPSRHFIVLANLLAGGVSSSPSNTPAPYDAARFPRVTLYDNVRLQQMLLTQALGVERIKLVAGWSMGGCQAYQWGAQYPDMVEAIAPLCCSARTGHFNKIFLLALRRALELDPAFEDGYYTRPPVRGLRAFATIYGRLGIFRAVLSHRGIPPVRRHHGGGIPPPGSGNPAFLHLDANDLLVLLRSWDEGDISMAAPYGGDFDRALGAITARAIVMPSEYDSYFPPVDSHAEGEPHAPCRMPADPVDLGPHDVVEPRGPSVHRCGAAGAALAGCGKMQPLYSGRSEGQGSALDPPKAVGLWKPIFLRR